MAIIKDYCPGCGNEIEIKIGQVIIENKLEWYRSMRCFSCGTAIEEDGDDIPEEMKAIIMEQEGIWGLSIETGQKQSLVYKILRESMNLPLSDIIQMRNSVDNTLLSGTKVEVEWLQQRLMNVGIIASLKQTNYFKR